MNFKKLFPQVLTSLTAVAIWESFRFLLNKAIVYNNMGHAGITNLWFILFFISVNLLCYLVILKRLKAKHNITAWQERDGPQKALPVEAIEMLGVIAATEQPFDKNRSKATINEVSLSETFSISHQKTKYLLELLERAGMFEIDKDFGICGVSHEGRKLLSKKERLP